MKYFMIICSFALMTSACTISSSDDDLKGLFDKSGGKPYSMSPLAGNIFGNEWLAKSAYAVPSADKDRLILRFRSDVPRNSCADFLPTSPYVEVNIPADYSVTEYPASVATGYPILFMLPGSSPQVLFADVGRFRINTVDASGFDLSIYALSKDQVGTNSQVNGQIYVTDCRKAVNFSVWEEFVGWATVTEFDGRTIEQTASIRKTQKEFYDRASGSWVNAIEFPLFSSLSSGSSSSYDFGPMEGLGQTTISTLNGVRTITYSYHGPIYNNGIDIELNLDMNIQTTGKVSKITYTLEVPKHIGKISHSFTLRK